MFVLRVCLWQVREQRYLFIRKAPHTSVLMAGVRCQSAAALVQAGDVDIVCLDAHSLRYEESKRKDALSGRMYAFYKIFFYF